MTVCNSRYSNGRRVRLSLQKTSRAERRETRGACLLLPTRQPKERETLGHDLLFCLPAKHCSRPASLATLTPIRQSDRNLMAGPVAVGLSCFWKTKQGFHDGSSKPHSAPPPTRRVAWTSARRTHWGLSSPLPRSPPEPSTEPEKHPGNNAKFPGNTDRPAVVPIGRRELPADDGLAATQSCTTQSTTWNLMNGGCLSGSPAVLMH